MDGVSSVCLVKNDFIGAWTEVSGKPSVANVAKIVGVLTTALLRTALHIDADETKVYVREIEAMSSGDPLNPTPEERVGHWTIGVKIGFKSIMLKSNRFLLENGENDRSEIKFNEDWVK